MQAYLEFSEDGGSGHKFYEARVEGTTITLRYGRIGTEGLTQTKTFPTPKAAQVEAEKKLAEKRKKGYADAVPGEREKRTVELPALRLPKLLAPHREALETTVRPYVRLRGSRGRTQPWSSKLGGLPYRPLGQDWPLSRETSRPLAFLAQLNFAELPHLEGFPSQGLVQFFVADDDYYGAAFDRGFDMDALGDDTNYRVLYHREVIQDREQLELTPVTYEPDPDGNGLPHDPGQEFVLRGEVTSGPVTSEDRLFDHLVGEPLWTLLRDEEAQDIDPDELLERYGRLAGSGHKLGGYPNFTQQDPRAVDDPHILLFQLDSDDDLELMWGDVGIAHFFIRPDDLARGDFSRVVYHWDCS